MCKLHDAHTKFHLCKFCGYSAHQEKELKEHIASIHEKRKDVLCNECGDAFASARHLKRHIDREHSTRVYVCPQCSKEFNTRENLYKHLQVHLPIKPHKCSLCDHRATKAYGVKVHLKSHGVNVRDISKSNYIQTDVHQLEELKSLAQAQLKDIEPVIKSSRPLLN